MTRLTSALRTHGSGHHRTPTRLLGGRSTVGHVALDHVIGVRIPASQPAKPEPVSTKIWSDSGTMRRVWRFTRSIEGRFLPPVRARS